MADKDPRSEDERREDEEAAAARRRMRERVTTGAAKLKEADPGQADLADLDDEALAARLLALGFDNDTAPLLPYLPLVQVAWADGAVEQKERVRIFAALKAARLPIGGGAWTLAEALLEERPTPAFLEESRRLLRTLLRRRGGDQAASEARAIVDLCLQVAESSGGLLGRWWRTSAVEAQAITAVAEALGPEATARLQEHLRGL